MRWATHLWKHLPLTLFSHERILWKTERCSFLQEMLLPTEYSSELYSSVLYQWLNIPAHQGDDLRFLKQYNVHYLILQGCWALENSFYKVLLMLWLSSVAVSIVKQYFGVWSIPENRIPLVLSFLRSLNFIFSFSIKLGQKIIYALVHLKDLLSGYKTKTLNIYLEPRKMQISKAKKLTVHSNAGLALLSSSFLTRKCVQFGNSWNS